MDEKDAQIDHLTKIVSYLQTTISRRLWEVREITKEIQREGISDERIKALFELTRYTPVQLREPGVLAGIPGEPTQLTLPFEGE